MLGYEGGYAGGWVIWLVALVVLVIVGYVVFRAAGASSRDRSTALPENSKQALRRRYARGEIGREEYERRMAELRR